MLKYDMMHVYSDLSLFHRIERVISLSVKRVCGSHPSSKLSEPHLVPIQQAKTSSVGAILVASLLTFVLLDSLNILSSIKKWRMVVRSTSVPPAGFRRRGYPNISLWQPQKALNSIILAHLLTALAIQAERSLNMSCQYNSRSRACGGSRATSFIRVRRASDSTDHVHRQI